MTNFTQKSSQQFFGAAMRVVTLTLFLAVFGASAVLAQTRAYVVNRNSDSVSVIDAATNTVVATVPVGNAPLQVAVTPNGAFAYVTNESDNSVSVISAATNTVVATVPVGAFPSAIAITPNGAFAYVGVSGAINVIATATDTVIATIPGVLASQIAITPNGASVYAFRSSPAIVTVIDTATNTETASVTFSTSGGGIAITPNGSFAYVGDLGFTSVRVLSTTTNTEVGAVGGLSCPARGIDFTPNGAFGYVACSGNVAVIDTATNELVTTVPAGSFPIAVAINPAGTFAYVVNRFSNDVSVINTSTNTVVATIPVGTNPLSIAFGVRTQGPTNKDQCKNSGWQTFTNPSFKNQGQCIKVVNHMDEGNN